MDKLIVIAGVTASGKSQIALDLAKRIDGVIINADSRQVYQEISIGTAKPTFQNYKDNIGYIDNIPHYLYSYVSVKEDYNLYRYQKDVYSALKEITQDKVPILVGGTGLYIDSVVYSYKLVEHTIINNNSDTNLDNLSVEELQEMIDKEELSKLNNSDINNPRRLVRLIQGRSYEMEKGEEIPHIYFVIDKPKEEINKNIEKRVDYMLENGLIEENKYIRDNDLRKYKALNTIGYQEFDDTTLSIEQVREKIITHTKQYAKRQRTWFRRNKEVIYVKSLEEITSLL